MVELRFRTKSNSLRNLIIPLYKILNTLMKNTKLGQRSTSLTDRKQFIHQQAEETLVPCVNNVHFDWPVCYIGNLFFIVFYSKKIFIT